VGESYVLPTEEVRNETNFSLEYIKARKHSKVPSVGGKITLRRI